MNTFFQKVGLSLVWITLLLNIGLLVFELCLLYFGADEGMFGLEIKYNTNFPRFLMDFFNGLGDGYVVSIVVLFGVPFFLNVYFSRYYPKKIKESHPTTFIAGRISNVLLGLTHIGYLLLAIYVYSGF